MVTDGVEDGDRYIPNNHQFISEHNCTYSNAVGPYNNAVSDSDIYVDPLFANAEGGDFHLQPGSSCIGAGTGGENIGD